MTLSEAARKYVGQKEKPGNSGFVDPAFDAAMRAIGWRAPWAWCAAFVKRCLRDAIDSGANLLNLANMGAMATWRLYKVKGMTGTEPRADSIAVWQHYKGGKPASDGSGHIAVCTGPAVDGKFPTIEGNTNAAGGREGDTVAEKKRPLSFDVPKGGNGLRLIGFAYPELK